MATPKKKRPSIPDLKSQVAGESSRPDVIFKKAFLTLAEQKQIYEKVCHIEPGFYVPVLRNGNKMALRMNCLGHHWSAVTYKYSTIRDIDGKPVAAVPAFFNELALRALRETDYWPANVLRAYDICIVNWYDEANSKSTWPSWFQSMVMGRG